MFRLIGLKPIIGSLEFRDIKLSRLRGRESELAVLQHSLQDAKRGIASVIGIAASAGVGKSRLCYEFGEMVPRAADRRFGGPGAHLRPLHPAAAGARHDAGVFPHWCGHRARGGARKLEEKLTALDPLFIGDIPYFADFLGLPAPELEGERIDARARHMRLLDIVRRSEIGGPGGVGYHLRGPALAGRAE